MSYFWENPAFRALAGDALRPGGLGLTRKVLSYLRDQAFWHEGGLALDMGCGTGASLDLLEEAGLSAVGLDLSFSGEKRAGDMSRHRTLIQARLEEPPFVSHCADLVLFECVLSLLKDPLAALQAAFRLLKAEGICVLCDLTVRPVLRQAASPLQPRQESFSASSSDLSFSCLSGARTVSSWQALLEEAGFYLLRHASFDHEASRLLARLIWYDLPSPGLCAHGSQKVPRYGYSVFIAARMPSEA